MIAFYVTSLDVQFKKKKTLHTGMKITEKKVDT